MKINCPVLVISAHALLCYLMLITGQNNVEKKVMVFLDMMLCSLVHGYQHYKNTLFPSLG